MRKRVWENQQDYFAPNLLSFASVNNFILLVQMLMVVTAMQANIGFLHEKVWTSTYSLLIVVLQCS